MFKNAVNINGTAADISLVMIYMFEGTICVYIPEHLNKWEMAGDIFLLLVFSKREKDNYKLTKEGVGIRIVGVILVIAMTFGLSIFVMK